MSRQGRGHACNRVGRLPEISRSSVLHTHHGKSKSARTESGPEQRRCPIDGRPVPLGFGRPKTYCAETRRREAAHRRHELDDLTADLADAREQLAAGGSASYWQGRIARLEREVSEQRARTPGALRP